MFSVPTEMSAADRARWLAEVSEALEEARLVLTSLAVRDKELDLVNDLYIRIEAARFEVRSLQLSRSIQSRDDNDPKRMKFAPWSDASRV